MSERLRDSVRYSRRHFAAVLGASTVGLSASWVAGAVPASIPWPTRQSWLTEALRRKDSSYDPLARMLVAPAAAGPAYPAVLRPRDVHPTRLSLAYAAALLDTGESWRVQRAREILGAVIPLQDQAPGRKSSGQWPWCLEEPLQNQTSIDWDDLCPTALLTARMIGRQQLRGSLEQQTREAIEYAARQPREPERTPAHRAIMQVGFVVLAVQELQLTDLRLQARGRLRRLYEHLMRAGSFDDYNSPSDSLQVLQELSRMLALVRDARDKALIRALHDLAWKHVATHFHAPSQQWAGPHSYNVETDLKKQPATLAFLQRGCGELAHLHSVDPFALSLEAYRLPLQCPRKWARAFGTLEAPRQTVETFALPDPAQPGCRQPITGTTWLHPRLTIGSVGRFLETSPAAARLLGHSGAPTVSARAISQGRPGFQFRALVQRSTSKSCPGRGRLEHGSRGRSSWPRTRP
ncbi:MAG TPA: hypothetical protein VNU68_33515 [Verrucomicrobiae bacterium]|nr:hypothetical protein [Verrucomicrobiae bacterium]